MDSVDGSPVDASVFINVLSNITDFRFSGIFSDVCRNICDHIEI